MQFGDIYDKRLIMQESECHNFYSCSINSIIQLSDNKPACIQNQCQSWATTASCLSFYQTHGTFTNTKCSIDISVPSKYCLWWTKHTAIEFFTRQAFFPILGVLRNWHFAKIFRSRDRNLKTIFSSNTFFFCSYVCNVYNTDVLPYIFIYIGTKSLPNIIDPVILQWSNDSNRVCAVTHFIKQTIFCINSGVREIWIAILVIVLRMEFISNLSIGIKKHIHNRTSKRASNRINKKKQSQKYWQ